MRKPHARSRLKILPPEQQKALFEHLSKHTLEETEAWLATGALTGESLDTSRSPLSEFFAWYPLASRLRGAADLTNVVKEVLRDSPDLDLDEEKLSKAGQTIFEKIAIETEDSELYTALRRLRQNDSALKLKARGDTKKAEQKDRELELATRRVALLERNAAKAKEQLTKIVEKGGLSPEALKQIEQAAKILQ